MTRLRGTRAPEGATASREYSHLAYQSPPLWPGITWGHDARCSCTWAYRDGVAQVKVRSGACTVHIGRRPAEPVPMSPAQALLAACQAGEATQALYDSAVESWHADRAAAHPPPDLGPLISLIAQAAGDAGWLSDCGTHNGYNKHVRDKNPACTPCGDAEREYSREAKRAQKRARTEREQAWQEAA